MWAVIRFFTQIYCGVCLLTVWMDNLFSGLAFLKLTPKCNVKMILVFLYVYCMYRELQEVQHHLWSTWKKKKKKGEINKKNDSARTEKMLLFFRSRKKKNWICWKWVVFQSQQKCFIRGPLNTCLKMSFQHLPNAILLNWLGNGPNVLLNAV